MTPAPAATLSQALHVRTFPHVDEILAEHAAALGVDATAYRNHVARVLNFLFALAPALAEEGDWLLAAAAFHDLGIWTDGTFDYLAPSRRRARAWLNAHGLDAHGTEAETLIEQHHKLRTWDGEFSRTVEWFRRADLVDLSLGMIRFGLPPAFVRDVQRAFPNAGFHRRLVQLTVRQFLRTPWRPLPMFRW